MDFSDKTVMVTGAGRGMGRVIALEFAHSGANVIATDVDDTSLQSLRNELEALGHPSLTLKMNVADSSSVNAGVAKAAERFDAIDILVNNAGIVRSSVLAETEESEWDLIIDVNLKGVWLCTKAVLPHMRKKGWGRIINLSSQAAKTAEFGNGAYCTSKAGVSMLTQVLALELAEFGIRVNAICPGYTDTELMRHAINTRGPLEGMSPEQYERQLLAGVPVGRMARPQEIAGLVAFLASDSADYITGAAINITGGKEMH